MNATEGLPTTSQPSVGAFLETFESALARCKDVVSINISNRLSGTIESPDKAAWLGRDPLALQCGGTRRDRDGICDRDTHGYGVGAHRSRAWVAGEAGTAPTFESGPF